MYDRDGYSMDTVPRLIRVNISLRASFPYGSTTPMPAPEVWRSWSDSVEAGLDEALPRAESEEGSGSLIAVIGWRSDIELKARCNEDGKLSLESVSVSAFRLVPVPRVWDDPDKREEEFDGGEHLEELGGRIHEAMEEWRKATAELGR